jgi:hypothetical protein
VRLNFNFDTTLEAFVVGGGAASTAGQLWNFGPGATCPDPGVGFISGDNAQNVCANNVVPAGGILTADSTLTATRQTTAVPLPASLLLQLPATAQPLAVSSSARDATGRSVSGQPGALAQGPTGP